MVSCSPQRASSRRSSCSPGGSALCEGWWWRHPPWTNLLGKQTGINRGRGVDRLWCAETLSAHTLYNYRCEGYSSVGIEAVYTRLFEDVNDGWGLQKGGNDGIGVRERLNSLLRISASWSAQALITVPGMLSELASHVASISEKWIQCKKKPTQNLRSIWRPPDCNNCDCKNISSPIEVSGKIAFWLESWLTWLSDIFGWFWIK